MDLESVSVRLSSFQLTYMLLFFAFIALVCGAHAVGFALSVLSLFANLGEAALMDWRMVSDDARLDRKRLLKSVEECKELLDSIDSSLL